jgi:hypothetical protein
MPKINTLRGRSRPKSNHSKILGLKMWGGDSGIPPSLGSLMSFRKRSHAVEIKVQLEHIDPRLTEKPKLPSLRMLDD